ncbi:MAG: prepilin-type N-terminal cleavage/methylation domain-containing protein [Deltaproteobacteria bacterium]|nr:prepilin-type N-terminal cleavage/methylation domain-containing protein [Deltaproteobacteria bacterium]
MAIRYEKGFTLVELLVVVALITILVAIAIPQLEKYRRRAWVTEVHSDLKQAYTAAQAYFTDYPSGTIDTAGGMSKLKAGGFNPSPNISIESADMTISSGNILLQTGIFIGNNNARVSFNGRRLSSAAE